MASRQRKTAVNECYNCDAEYEVMFRVTIRTDKASLPNYYTLCADHAVSNFRDDNDSVLKIERIEI